MLDLKVLMTTYHSAFLNKGGGEIEMVEMANGLRELGALVDIYGPNSRPLEAYDTILHFSTHADGLPLLRAVKEAGKRVVLWPNIWMDDLEIGDDQSASIQEHLDLADCVLVKSNVTKERLEEKFTVENDKIKAVPAGVDAVYGVRGDDAMFRTIYGVGEYILWLGIIEERKNQLFAIEALKDLEIPVVFVGNYRDKAYYDACVAAAPEHFKFLPYMPPKSEILRSALQNCKLYLEAPCDHPGLSAIEAGLAGAQLVLSDDAWSREHFGENASYVDPTSKESILEGVKAALACDCPPALEEQIRATNILPQCLEPVVRMLMAE